VYRAKKTRNATFAMRVGDGRFGILHPPAPQARSVTDSASSTPSVLGSLR
jgi:hypothetical protein